eukprot:304466-Chlamydomonas_euryale.AAC.1
MTLLLAHHARVGSKVVLGVLCGQHVGQLDVPMYHANSVHPRHALRDLLDHLDRSQDADWSVLAVSMRLSADCVRWCALPWHVGCRCMRMAHQTPRIWACMHSASGNLAVQHRHMPTHAGPSPAVDPSNMHADIANAAHVLLSS